MEKEALELIQSNQITTTFNLSQFRGGQPQHDHDEVKQRTPQEISDRAGQGQGQGYSHIVDVDTRPDSISFTHVAICSSEESSSASSLEEVQESTSTLVAARALIKANQTDDAWSCLRSLFAMQGTNGFMPRYIYWNNHHHDNNTHMEEDGEYSYYYNGTHIPKATLFPSAHTLPTRYTPCPSSLDQHTYTYQYQYQYQYAPTPTSMSCLDINDSYTYTQELNISTSGRLSALPMHATSLLELFYLSNQTMHDLNQLRYYFDRIYKMHYYWMEHVMKYCTGTPTDDTTASDTASDSDTGNSKPCYNIIHPWESLVPMDAPQWEMALAHIIDIVQEKKWTPNPRMKMMQHENAGHYMPLPLHFPKNESVYHAMLYLLECHANVTSSSSTSSSPISDNGNDHGNSTLPSHSYPQSQSQSQSSQPQPPSQDYELELLQQCPFAMLDLSHLAILSKSHRDLYQIGKILHDSHSRDVPTRAQSSMSWME